MDRWLKECVLPCQWLLLKIPGPFHKAENQKGTLTIQIEKVF
jgi:hypothetical protein